MERRKFLIGAGSLAAGGAAALGSGAFTSTSANRSVAVEVADDAKAFLSLDASVSPYAEETDGTVEFQFDGSSDSTSGQGLNDNADTTFTNVLKVENQSADPFRLQLYSGDSFGSFAQGPLVVSYSDGQISTQTASTVFDNSPDAPSYWAGPSGSVTAQDVGVGDDLYIHFSFFLSERTNFGASNDPTDIPDTIIFNAGSSQDNLGSDFS